MFAWIYTENNTGKMHQLASTTPMEETEKEKYTEFNKCTWIIMNYFHIKQNVKK